jgi:hypothetical protein
MCGRQNPRFDVFNSHLYEEKLDEITSFNLMDFAWKMGGF